MFKNQREMAIGLASSNDEFKDNDNNRYRCVDDGKGHSPFQVQLKEIGSWRPIEAFWSRYAELREASELPDLEINTEVLVRNSAGEDVRTRHFEGWQEDGKMLCFNDGRTSFTNCGSSSWKYWRVSGGECVGENNMRKIL